MSTKVTVKGQVTLPKAVRQAAGIRPGDRVNVRLRPEGGLVVEREDDPQSAVALTAARRRIDEALNLLDRQKLSFGTTTDEWMALTRGED